MARGGRGRAGTPPHVPGGGEELAPALRGVAAQAALPHRFEAARLTDRVLAVLTVATCVAVALTVWRQRGGGPTPRELAENYLRAAQDGVGGAFAPASAAERPFREVAASVGLTFVHDNGAHGRFQLPEEMGPGAGLFDYDNDGDLDAFICGGGAIAEEGPAQTCAVFRNDRGRFVNVTHAAGAAVPGPAYGVAAADYDDDGDVDLFVTRLGPNVLLRNNGDGTFADVTAAAGVGDAGFGASAAFFDYDRDGRMDLYVCNYVDWTPQRETPCYTILGVRDYCNPKVYNALSVDRLYHNAGAGRFDDVTEAAGIATERGLGLGVLASDFDGDGWIDLFVANDQTPAFLWRNRGNGTFENVSAMAGCAYDGSGVAIAGMGVAAEDLDGDGRLDLFVTNIHDQLHLVLRNEGSAFDDVGRRMGLAAWSIPLTGFGVVLFDQNHDGALDAYIANGEVNIGSSALSHENPYAQPDSFVRLVQGKFRDASAELGRIGSGVGRAVAWGDIDNDGDIDLLVTNNGGPVELLQNAQAAAGRWLMVDARLGAGRGAAIGAQIEVQAAGRRYLREIRPQQSYLSSGDPRAHFGLGDAAEVQRLIVRWVDGRVSELGPLPADQVLRVTPDDGTPEGRQ